MPTKSFEDRLARLEQVAESLKDGKIPLEEAIALFEEGSKLAKTLEKANIILNKNMIPGDESPVHPSGLRIGVQEMTRFGLKEEDMKQVATLIKRVIIDKENPEQVKKEVIAFRKKFQGIKYCL